MLILASTNDKVKVTTSITCPVDVHVSWVDNASSVITPGRTNTQITVAGTVSVSDSTPPLAAGAQRNVRTLHALNRDPTLTCDVTILHDTGTALCKLFSATLKAGEAIELTDQGGFQIMRKVA